MKLEVGMYVRKVNGNIEKITGVQDVKYTTRIQRYFSCSEPEDCFLTEDDITKTSHNLIDLIEVGDYVNGKKVVYVWKFKSGNNLSLEGVLDINNVEYAIHNDDIKSILTKEQYEANCYKVVE